MRIVLTVFLFLFYLHASAQKTDNKLQRQVEQMIAGFHGSIGIYVHDVTTSKTIAINADTTFPTASMVKIPILIGIMDKINKGELDYHQNLMYRDSLLYPGIDILGSFKDSQQIDMSKVMMLMLTMSDNTASLWLQSLAGGSDRINRIMDSLGFVVTRDNSRTPNRAENSKQYGWGQTTPREMAALMEMIVNRKVITDSLSGRMLRLLSKNYWDEEGISQIPPDVFVADKHGSLDDSRSEIMFVNGRGRRYIVCICTKNNADQTWQLSNEAWTLTRKISKLLWDWYQ